MSDFPCHVLSPSPKIFLSSYYSPLGIVRGVKFLDLLFVIPAKEDSERCPGKNKELIAGFPLWGWAVHHCKQAVGFMNATDHRIVVSTDDPEIRDNWSDGVTVRLERPAELCTREATSESVCLHALEHFPADMVVLVQPTSPLRRPLDIVRCIMACPAVTVSVCSAEANGACYTMFSESLRKGWLFESIVKQIAMPEERSIDIDTKGDLAQARAWFDEHGV
jgi:CMP-N-acetylneuraminic acid synthetase